MSEPLSPQFDEALRYAFRARMPGHPLVVELELAVAELVRVAP